MRLRRWIAALACAATLLPRSRAEAETRPPPPRHRIVYTNLTAGRINPLGLVNEFNIGYRLRLLEPSHVLFGDTHLSLMASSYISPSDVELGALLLVKPLAILWLSAKVAYYGLFGTFGNLQSFPSPRSEHSDTDMDRRDEADLDYTTNGLVASFGARLQGKLGPVAARSTLMMYYADLNLAPGDRVYYHTTLDILMPDRGWALSNELDVIYATPIGLLLGLRYTVVHALYSERHFAPGEPTDNPNTPMHRLGPAFVYTILDRPSKGFHSLTAFVLAEWYLAHRYRTGADVSAGIPRVVIGASFQGDLWP
jgi:hypothetical protein